MPIYLEPRDVIDDLGEFNSVLIVSCPICPRMSLAMQTKTPLVDVLKHGLKTEAFEDYVGSIREPLERRGIRTEVFTTVAPSPMMCLWTEGQRNRLLKRASDHDAVVVLGCSSATHIVEDILEGADCKIFTAMQMKAIATGTMRFEFPMKVQIDKGLSPKERRARRQAGSAASEKEGDSTP